MAFYSILRLAVSTVKFNHNQQLSRLQISPLSPVQRLERSRYRHVAMVAILLDRNKPWSAAILSISALASHTVVQQRQWNVQKIVMHLQSCCFANLNLLIFAVLVAVAVVVEIHKFCYHGNVMSHLSLYYAFCYPTSKWYACRPCSILELYYNWRKFLFLHLVDNVTSWCKKAVSTGMNFVYFVEIHTGL